MVTCAGWSGNVTNLPSVAVAATMHPMENNWYRAGGAEVAAALESPASGLTAAEAMARRERFGANRLPRPARITGLQIILHQFQSPLIYVLLAAAVVSLLLAEYLDAAFIALVLSINAFLGGIQEWRAESSATALQSLLKIHARVRRGGQVEEIDAEDLVLGDRVLLDSGMRVPADLRIVALSGLEIEEAALTGESVAVFKATDPIAEAPALGDQRNMAFAGTTVVAGRGEGVVVATGRATEVGKIAADAVETEAGKVPLIERMDAFSRRISYAVLAVGAVIVAIGLWRGMSAHEIFFIAVAVAVSAIPEGLPVAMTVALSIGMRRMAARHVLVRRLAAVEGLGSCTFIATDKTGTLTLDQQTVTTVRLADGTVLAVTGTGFSGAGRVTIEDGTALSSEQRKSLARVVRAAALCNDGSLHRQGDDWGHSGDPVDVALLALGFKAGFDPVAERAAVKVVGAIPFDAATRAAAVWTQDAAGALSVSVKGAVEVLAPLVRNAVPAELQAQADRMAAEGLRVLAVGGGRADAVVEDALPEIDLYGLVGMIDPLRPEAASAVAECQAAGITVAMVTGDHPATALAIARDLGIADGLADVVTGAELGHPEDPQSPEWQARLAGRRVFARVDPLQKRAIVEGLAASGHFVAVTGDGVNDAAALRAAHLGVAMGSGTDVARDAASLVVTDNNFASITAAVEEGRYVYANLRGIIRLLVSTGFAEVMLVLLALIVGMPLPLTALQLLWLNLVTNGIQDVSLAFEPGDPAEMKKPPRRTDEGVFDATMIRGLVTAGVSMTALSFGLWWWALEGMGLSEAAARNLVVLLVVMMQNVHTANCRSETRSIFRPAKAGNPVLWVGILTAQGVHLLVMQTGFGQQVLGFSPVTMGEWAMLLPLAAVVVLTSEIEKWFGRRRLA